MPQIGPFEFPNHDINRIVELVKEAKNRVTIQQEKISEDTFSEDIIDKRGGTYTRYRYSLQQYGLIEREYGSDEITITSRFVDIADPLDSDDREKAIKEAVTNVNLFNEMYEAGFGPDFSDREFRKWLIENKNVSRADVSTEDIKEVRQLYEAAYDFLQEVHRGKVEETDERDDTDERGIEQPRADQDIPGDGNVEKILIGDMRVVLPKDDIKQKWEVLKNTVDAYIDSVDAEDGGNKNN